MPEDWNQLHTQYAARIQDIMDMSCFIINTVEEIVEDSSELDLLQLDHIAATLRLRLRMRLTAVTRNSSTT